MLKIGIISDTHKRVGRAQRAISLLLDSGAQYIIHAGDIVKPEVLEYIRDTNLPYVAVYGNNDAHLSSLHDRYNLVAEPHYFAIKNLKLKLMHTPLFLAPDADIVIYGHTHSKFIEYTNNTLFLNSGEVCGRDKPLSECMMLSVTKEAYIVEYLHRALKQSEWKREVTHFKRQNATITS